MSFVIDESSLRLCVVRFLLFGDDRNAAIWEEIFFRVSDPLNNEVRNSYQYQFTQIRCHGFISHVREMICAAKDSLVCLISRPKLYTCAHNTDLCRFLREELQAKTGNIN